MSTPAERYRQRAAAARGLARAPGEAPFASFFERQEDRTRRARTKRRVLVISVAAHVLLLGGLALSSAWNVDELFGRRVAVSVVPAEAAHPPAGQVKAPARLNLARALGARVVVTPQGAHREARPGVEPLDPDTRARLDALVQSSLLPALTYPELARPLRLQGAVTVLVDVDAQGTVTGLGVKEPCIHPLLCDAAKAQVAAVTDWPPGAGPRSFAIPLEFKDR
ncbi:MAG: energy transducer TonB [Myxococcales bacterium]|nr:energy transducer TonB [Myxococcales bacterium]